MWYSLIFLFHLVAKTKLASDSLTLVTAWQLIDVPYLSRVVDVGAKEVNAVKPLLRDLPDIIVGTPGRLAQHLKYVFINVPYLIRRSDLDSESGSGYRKSKMSSSPPPPPKKKTRNLMFYKARYRYSQGVSS